MTTNDTSTRATIARDSDAVYYLTVRTLPNSSEDIFVTANLTREDVETIAGWANAPKDLPGKLDSIVCAGLVELTFYPNHSSIGVTVSNWESAISWQLTETSSRDLIEEAGRWTR